MCPLDIPATSSGEGWIALRAGVEAKLVVRQLCQRMDAGAGTTVLDGISTIERLNNESQLVVLRSP